MQNLGIVIGLIAITFGLYSVAAAIRYVANRIDKFITYYKEQTLKFNKYIHDINTSIDKEKIYAAVEDTISELSGDFEDK